MLLAALLGTSLAALLGTSLAVFLGLKDGLAEDGALGEALGLPLGNPL